MNNDPESPKKIVVLTKRVGNAPHESQVTSPSRFSFLNSLESHGQSIDNDSSMSLQSLTHPNRSHSSFLMNGSLAGSQQGILGPSSNPRRKYDRQKSLFSTERVTTSTTKKNIVVYLIITLIAIGLIYGIIAYAFMAKKEGSSGDGYCDSQTCRDKSAAILSSLNATVDPCEDFYEYSCGSKFIDKNARQSLFEMVTNRISELKKTLLESSYNVDDLQSPEERDKDHSIFDKVQGYYQTCMNEAQIKSIGVEPLVSGVSELLKSFPIANTDGKTLSPSLLADSIAYMHSYGVEALFGITLGKDTDDPNSFAINLAHPSLTLTAYDANTTVPMINAIQNIFPIIWPSFTGDLTAIAKNIADFETKLSNIFVQEDSSFTLDNLRSFIPSLDVGVYMQNFFLSTPSNRLNGSSVIYTKNANYFKSIDAVLKQTDPVTMEGYLVWSFTRAFAKFVYPTDAIASVINVSSSLPMGTRSSQCINFMESFFIDYLAKMVVKNLYSEEQTLTATRIMDNIKNAFLMRLNQITWLDTATLGNAIEKLKQMKYKIAYPESLFNMTEQFQQVKQINLDPNNFGSSSISAQNNYIYTKVRVWLKEPFPKDEWSITPTFVNAFYVLEFNELIIPQAILSVPFLDLSLPDYINYGSLGAIMGHELIHAFDSNGAFFGPTGKKENWWTDSSFKIFKDKSQCFVDEYSSFKLSKLGTTMFVNGNLTLSENMADNGGHMRSLEAWKMDTNAVNTRIPGLERFSPQQLLYISFAQTWCTPSRGFLDMMNMLNDPHSPPRFRVNGVLRNSEEFSRAFGCKKDSFMNPADKCVVW